MRGSSQRFRYCQAPSVAIGRYVRTIRIHVPALLCVGIAATALAGAVKDSYRPDAHPFPQIIQDNDYQTIEAIEAFVSKLKSGGHDTAACSNAQNLVSQANYPHAKAAAFFATLKRLQGDLSHNETCRAVKFEQFSTPAYARRTIVEFDFGAIVVVVDAFSNGSANDEHLYILDAVERSRSYFWGGRERPDG